MSAPCAVALDFGGVREGRAALKAARAALAQEFLATPRSARYLARHAALIDSVLQKISLDAGLSSACCLVAVGGYGRGELFPGSDVDLLLLLPDEPTEAEQEALSNWVRAAWDIGLEIGHSVRTIEQCLAESADITVETNLIEARYLWGDAALFAGFLDAFNARFDALAFFDAKLAEQTARHQRFDDSAYKLEPHLKDSPGGLRDIHTIHWLARACRIHCGWKGLAEAGLLTPEEARRVAREEAHLNMLRIHLHLLAGRREDRLAFDYQHDLATSLKLDPGAHKRPGEKLMQGYYRAAKLVQRANDVLIQSLRERLAPIVAPPQPLDDDFQLRGGQIEIRDATLFTRKPTALLIAFLHFAQHREARGFEAATLRALWRGASQIDAAFRAHPEHRALFMQLLREPQGLTHALRAMHRYGLLGRYIPAFGRIVGQMQHDLFHIYTVDEHILIVLRNLRRLAVPEFAHEFPLASRLIAEFGQPELLYLGALFHDIAKGRGGDHSELGRVDAQRFCKLHGLGPADAEFVSWLVEMHLVMSRVAQKEDIGDPDTVAAFALKMHDERHLVALYLLTIADIRGTSPKVWNAWKGKLLEDLFRATRAHFAGRSAVPDLAARQADARARLALYGLQPATPDALWSKLDARYFTRFDPAEIAWHARMLWRHVVAPAPLVRARLSPVGEGIQVLVYAPDQPDLFLRICGFFARIQYTIVEAQIHTTHHGYALDRFQVMDLARRGIHYRDFLSYVEYELARDLDPARPVEPVPRGRLSRQQRHHPYTPEIRFEAHADSATLHLRCADRAGLLFAIADVLARHGIALDAAKIDTLGERVEDAFQLRGEDLRSAEGRARLEQELLSVVTN